LEIVKRVLGEFEIVDYKSTVEFIAKYPDLTSLLNQTRRAIRRYFKDTKTRVVPKTDPETGKEELWLYVYTDLPVPEALNILDKFDEDFFIKILKKSDNKLCFDLIFE
jgi:hypothetical protein